MPRRRKSIKGIFFALILGIIIGLIGFYLWKNYQPQESIPPAVKLKEIKSGKDSERPEEGQEPQPGDSWPEISRQKIMEYVTDNISNLSPVEPVLGGKWRSINFWFADDYHFYVDYEDGHILRRLLISVRGSTDVPEYRIVGYFEPGEDQWILKEGEDTIFGKDFDLYGWDEESKAWLKRN